jgi:hypothetical protein
MRWILGTSPSWSSRLRRAVARQIFFFVARVATCIILPPLPVKYNHFPAQLASFHCLILKTQALRSFSFSVTIYLFVLSVSISVLKETELKPEFLSLIFMEYSHIEFAQK